MKSLALILSSSLLVMGSFHSLKAEQQKRVEIVSYCGRLPPKFSDPQMYLPIKRKFKTNYHLNLTGFARKFGRDDPNLHKIVFIDCCLDPKMVKLPKDKLICFKWEPDKFDPVYYNFYSRVYTFEDKLIDNKKFFKYYYPVLRPMLQNIPSFKEKKLCCMIATRWLPDRIKILDFFAKKPKDSFHLYGSVRRVPKYIGHPMFKGSIYGFPSSLQKSETLSKYRFCICFENTHDTPGYITEKIFDVFSGGCVPIYWGSDMIEKYIPKKCFIDYRAFKNDEEMYRYITSMGEHEYQCYLRHIRNFLKSPQARLFSVENFEKTLCDAVLN